MNRRDAVKNVALMLGGSFSAPTLLAMSSKESKKPIKQSTGDLTISENHKKIIAEVAEMIIPRTATPGAIDVGVPAFVVMMIQDCYRKPEHISFLAGLEDLERQKFLSQSKAEKVETLIQVEKESKKQMEVYQVQQTKMGDNEDREQMKEQQQGLPFWRLMKELTLLGYFTSEEGLKSSFEYIPVPGKLELIKLKPGQKSFAY